MKLDKIKNLAKQLLAACDEAGDIEHGSAPEHENEKKDSGDSEGGDDVAMKSLSMKLGKYK